MEARGKTSVIIFGATGDLTSRKLIPSLFNNFRKGRLKEDIQIIGTSRREMTHEEFRQWLHQGATELAGIDCPAEEWERFSERLWYISGDAKEKESFQQLENFIRSLEAGSANRLYYLATSPSLFPSIVEQLGEAGMASEEDLWRRIVIEKPFGQDFASAAELNRIIHTVFQEHQVFRIDHYLGKETAQNILYFRFLNTIFEPIWNRNTISHVQITVAEKVDVGHRAGYYDETGVLRDMFQNHLLQLLTLVAMEPAATFNADAIRNEKVKVLQSIRPVSASDTVRAQYEGYCEAEGVSEGSQTPTFTALKLHIDNWRWNGVPFYLRSGKALPSKVSEIVIEFKEPPHVFFPLPEGYHLTPNFLSLCIQPDEGVHLRFETKVPDSAHESRSVDMDFHYSESFGGSPLPDAYERLLLDALIGDASLFTRSDEIEAAWNIIDPIQRVWDATGEPAVLSYPPGSWGPNEAQDFIERDGFVWRLGCE
ncbi:MAG: glucose-6-phosphate dehydrogenase [Anaerolineales bacterium]|nr:MAG: glucose-6-phosphate dehydrogenase [Anaerolineales bacterium]